MHGSVWHFMERQRDREPFQAAKSLTGDARLEFLRNSETGEIPRSSAT